jgi:hypothetical protein
MELETVSVIIDEVAHRAMEARDLLLLSNKLGS